MGLLPFAELAAGASLDNGATVDTNKVAAAAKFVPYGLSVTRTLDLSGGGGAQESAAQLTGAVMIPQELAPPKWGAPKLDEAVDAKGNDLKPAADDKQHDFPMRSHYSENESGDEETSETNHVQQHMVALAFCPPDWKINEIARIKGSISLQYFGGSQQVVKLTNAVPAKWITDASKMMGGGGFDPSEKSLTSAALADLGLSLSVQMGLVQSGMKVLSLQVKGTQTTLTDAQVFDADGKPWPTFLQLQDSGGEQSSCQITVAGKPQPPLSLALAASGGDMAVTVPILVEHVALTK